MKRSVVFGFIAVLFVSVPGCGNSPDSLMKQGISQMNDLATAIEKKESPEKIKSIGEKLKATSEKLDALKLSDDQKKQLQEKYKNEMMEALKRLMAAAMANPEAAKSLESVGPFGGKK